MKLFDKVYSGNLYYYYHDCKDDGAMGLISRDAGICEKCEKFIATYKKLKVMRALKELND